MKFGNLDIIVFFIVASSSILGLYKGLIKIVISFLSSIAILYLTYICAPFNSELLGKYINNELLNKLISTIGFYIILSIIASFILSKIYKSTENVSGSLVDRFFGLIFGFIRGLVIAFVSFILLIVITGANYKNARNIHDVLIIDKKSLPKWISESMAYDTMNSFFNEVLPILPESILNRKINELHNNKGSSEKENLEDNLEKNLEELMIKSNKK